MKKFVFLLAFLLLLTACASPTAAPTATSTATATTVPSPTPTLSPTGTPTPTPTPDPFAGLEYNQTISLGGDFEGYAAAVDEAGQLVAVSGPEGNRLEPNEAGLYPIGGRLWAWNSGEGRLVEAFDLNAGNLRRWDSELGRYNQAKDKDGKAISRASELKWSQEGLLVIDKDGGLILHINADGQMQELSKDGLLTIGEKSFYWHDETQELREIFISSENPAEVAVGLGLTLEEGQQFVMTQGENPNDGDWYNYVTLAGENPEHQGARLARLNPDGTWTVLEYQTQAGKEEMFGHLVPMDERAIIGSNIGDKFHRNGNTVERTYVRSHYTGLRSSFTLDNYPGYEEVEIIGPLGAMRDGDGDIILGVPVFTSPQLIDLYLNDYVRISDYPDSGMNYVAGETEAIWKLMQPGQTMMARVYTKLDDLGTYSPEFYSIDGKQVGSEVRLMRYYAFWKYEAQVAELMKLLANGGEPSDPSYIFVTPQMGELILAPLN